MLSGAPQLWTSAKRAEQLWYNELMAIYVLIHAFLTQSLLPYGKNLGQGFILF